MDMFEQDLRSLQQPPQRSTECACAWFKHFNHPIILHLQTFFFRVFLHKQQAFSSGNLYPERPTTTITAIKTQVFVFRYQRVNWTRKFTIVAEIVSLLKKIYKWDAPFGAVFKVKTLAVLFPPCPHEMKTNTAKFISAATLPSLTFFYGNGATYSHARSIARARLKHAHSFGRCGTAANRTLNSFS